MGGDALDHAVAFLKQRDGIDKMLKLMRYAVQLSAHKMLLLDPTSVTGAKLKHLDASTAVARKFVRLGKFLGNAKELRALLLANDALASARARGAVGDRPESAGARRLGRAALLTNRIGIACQGVQLVYNFLEQGNWAIKTGLIR